MVNVKQTHTFNRRGGTIEQVAFSSVAEHMMELTIARPGEEQRVERLFVSLQGTDPEIVVFGQEQIIAVDSYEIANPGLVNLAKAHGKTGTFQVLIFGSTTTPSIDGIQTATVVDTDTFSVPINVTGIGEGVGNVALEPAILVGAAQTAKKPDVLNDSTEFGPFSIPIGLGLAIGTAIATSEFVGLATVGRKN